MKHINFEKTFGLIIGAIVGILLVAHISGCGSKVSPEAISLTEDSIVAADSITHAVYLDSINLEIDKADSLDSLSRNAEIQMNLKFKK